MNVRVKLSKINETIARYRESMKKLYGHIINIIAFQKIGGRAIMIAIRYDDPNIVIASLYSYHNA